MRLTQLLVLGMVLLAATASSGAAAPSRGPAILGAVPHAGATAGLHGLSAAPASDDVALQESPCALDSSPEPCWTMRTNATYAIYWVPSGYSVDPNYQSFIDRYLADVAAASGSLTNVYSVATQYYDNAAAIHYQSVFGGSFVDTTPFPPSGCDDGNAQDTACLTDAQLQTELQNVINARGWHAGTDAMFFILTPNHVGSCFDGSDQDCTTNTFCAYHSGFEDASNEPVLYANQPYDAAISGCHSRAGEGFPNDPIADPTINAMSHEHIETITDPWGDAWLNSAGDEIADICVSKFGAPLGTAPNGQPYNQLINGHPYSLQTEYSNDGSGCLQQYAPTVAPATVAAPVVTGATGVGQQLSSSEGSWMHAPTGYGYQWQRCSAGGAGCVNISGATGSTYVVTTADLGDTLRSVVVAYNAVGTSVAVASAPSSVVVVPPASTGAPLLSGVAAVGKTLTTSTGSWNTSVTFAYQWLRCAPNGSACTPISGATAATHVEVAADAGHRLQARVSATNAAGAAQAVTGLSGVVIAAPHARKAPHISGRARVGRLLSAAKGSWTGPPKSYRYQWLRCNAHGGSCVRISHATRARYRLTRHDARHRLRVRVTAVNAAGSRIASSRATARVPG
ncbi:MAG TPA: hypothetical protein VJ814_03050 [Gaiellaceae bacterium]|nr:hypothetical protein [Gaiellaceae bacterium]